jgi:hypothetical protein
MKNNFVSDLIEKMGGVEAFAIRTGFCKKTVRNWKNANLIPNNQNQRTEVIKAAQDLGIIIRGSDFVYEMKGERK